MLAFVRCHALAVFVALAYAISWAHWIPLALSGAIVTPGGSGTHFPGLLGPALAAFIVTFLTEGGAGVLRLLRSMLVPARPHGRLLAYSLSPIAFLALALVVAPITGMALPPASAFAVYSGLPPLPLPLVLLLVLIFNGYGEETGWRGFALARLQERFGPLKGALVLALIWAGWHTPAFFCIEGYRSLGVAGLIGGFGLGICAGSLVLARIANRTGGSVLAAAVWHAAYNMTSATAASRGVIGAVTTTCVMAWATLLLVQEWRRPLERSRLAVGPGV
jgi:membrane protease YdiL (CAAX protease family)